ncbi:RNA-binding protein [Candidatus Woesearchaeota archaeon]|nr:RNA-binding protein [Candidatus Woesearchaeota archaeon]
MGKLLVQEKEIVVPGQQVAEGMDYVPGYGTYREGENILAGRLGLVAIEGRMLKLIPLAGRYIPKRNDTVIGRVIDVTMSGWRMDLNSAYSALLNVKDATNEFIPKSADLTQLFNFGDYVVTKIINVTPQFLVDLTMKAPGLYKLPEGRIISVTPVKIPRVIGKRGSMVSMIKNATGCQITVGQNGLVWVHGREPAMELIADKTIRMIEEQAHTSGLTERVKAFLEEQTGKTVEVPREDEEYQEV